MYTISLTGMFDNVHSFPFEHVREFEAEECRTAAVEGVLRVREEDSKQVYENCTVHAKLIGRF